MFTRKNHRKKVRRGSFNRAIRKRIITQSALFKTEAEPGVFQFNTQHICALQECKRHTVNPIYTAEGGGGGSPPGQ